MTGGSPAHESPGLPEVAVIGAGGQLGSDLVEVLEATGRYRVRAYGRNELDVTDALALEREFEPGRFLAAINTAALTNVDLCEEQGDQALSVNAVGAYLVARACARAGTKNVLIGTDFVFDGDKGSPYLEDDTTNPINVYGASKLAGERVSLLAAPETLIVRISSVFGKAGARGKGGNFVETILAKAREGAELRVIDEITMSPTYTADVAQALPALLDSGATGVVHLANSGHCSWYEFARKIVESVDIEARLEPVGADAYPRLARRPRNSSLVSARIAELIGRPMREWQAALEDYLIEKGHINRGESGAGEEER